MSRLIRVVAVAVALAAILGGWRWWNGPERQIRRLLSDVAADLSDRSGQRGLARAAEVAALGRHLAAGVRVEPGRPFEPIEGRDAVVAAAAGLRSASPGMRVAFTDVGIVLARDRRSAAVDATATATFRDRPGARQVEAREVLLALTLAEGRWVIAQARAVPVLERID
ncbi:MAG: hypothetical protein H6Q10_1088 [Acidobacteria bacterium]|nr:hypothetical protein [Acidobacteriota bacterium]